MKKKILIHSLVFSPDSVSTAYLYNDIALGFRDAGYDVVVLTTTPHYNLVEGDLKKQPLKKRFFGIFYKSDFKGIPVYHVPQKKFKNFPLRALGFVFFHVLSLILGLFQRNLSIILSPSPPLTIGIVSIIIGKLKRAKIIYNVQEIYPDFLINQGNLKPGLFLRVLRKIEKFVYDYSDAVVTIDKIFYKTIVARFKDPTKLTVIPNFVDTDIYKIIPGNKLKIDRKIFPETNLLNVMYAGNIGHAQDWEPLLETAKMLKDELIKFWVIGEGVVMEKLKRDIQKHKLENICMLPYQPREYMAELVNYADIHFIFMNPQMEGQGFPSKVYTIMSCGKPLLIASGFDTPLYQFLENTNCAFLVNERDFQKKVIKIYQTLKEIIADKSILDEMGENGFELIREKYSKSAVVAQYVRLGDELLND